MCDFNPPSVCAHLSKVFFFSDLQTSDLFLNVFFVPEYKIIADYDPFKNGPNNGVPLMDNQLCLMRNTSDLFELFLNWEEISSQREFSFILFGIIIQN